MECSKFAVVMYIPKGFKSTTSRGEERRHEYPKIFFSSFFFSRATSGQLELLRRLGYQTGDVLLLVLYLSVEASRLRSCLRLFLSFLRRQDFVFRRLESR